MRTFTIGRTRIDPAALAVTIALGSAGGAAANWLGLPLGYLLGSLVCVAAAALTGLRIFGQTVHMPNSLRMVFIPVIGVGIGGAFTLKLLEGISDWIPSLAALCLFVPIAHFCGYRIYRMGGLDLPTAYYGSVPGGLVESVTLGEEAGADIGTLVLIQFLRLIVTIVTVPIMFALLTGHAVGSSAGAVMAGSNMPMTAQDAAILIVAGVGGYFVGRKFRFPAAIMTGPLAASALAHLTGLTAVGPPGWTIALTQLMIGTGLGARFAGMAGATLRRGFILALLATGVSLLLAFIFAELLYTFADQPISAVFLAFAPGGISEMSLIALSLNISVVYVTLHHVLRIVLSISIARLFARRVL